MPEELGAAATAEPEIGGGAEETVETSTESTESSEISAQDSNQDGTQDQKQDLTAKTGGKSKLNLTDVVKKSADKLKAIDPALPGALRTAAYELNSLYHEFPGGLKEAVALKQSFDAIGGVGGAQELQEAVSDYSRLEGMFEQGDPKFMENLAEALPGAFSQIMPAGLAKWKAVDQENYSHNMAKVIVQTMDSAKVSGTLEAIWNNLDAEKQGPVKDAVASIWELLNDLRKESEKVPERKIDPKTEVLNQREQELAQREQQAMMAPIRQAGERQIETILSREMMRDYQWDKTDGEVRQAVLDRVKREIIKASAKDSVFSREFDRLQDRGDAQGLERHVRNFQDRVTPAIVSRVAKIFAVKPKNAGAVVKKPVTQTTTAAAKVERGWETVSRQPNPGQIDYRAMGRNADDLILSNKAILKDGRKVQWA